MLRNPGWCVLLLGLAFWSCSSIEEPSYDNPLDPYSAAYVIPRPPFNAIAESAPTRVVLAWVSPAVARNSVTIERRAGSQTSFTVLAVVPLLPATYTDSAPVIDSVNTYRIAMVALDGNVTYSNQRSVTPHATAQGRTRE
jgi:hypothetical protein